MPDLPGDRASGSEARGRFSISRAHLLDLLLHDPFDLGDRRIGRLLQTPLRPTPGSLDLLTSVLADCPDGDLGSFTQLLDMPGALDPLFPADRRDADALGGQFRA
jgi:hypothetical protein